jgi:hypothetical protein
MLAAVRTVLTAASTGHLADKSLLGDPAHLPFASRVNYEQAKVFS